MSDYLIGVITFRQLRYLAALAEHRHFGRAAEACAMTQPALSMQIRELEATSASELVERRHGDVALTEIGAEVVRRGERLLAAARDLVDFARHRGRLLTGGLAARRHPHARALRAAQDPAGAAAAVPGLRGRIARDPERRVSSMS